MNHRENLKQIVDQIQDILNTDVKDVDTKMQVAEQLDKLNKELADYTNKLQDEIFDDMMSAPETADPFDFTDYD